MTFDSLRAPVTEGAWTHRRLSAADLPALAVALLALLVIAVFMSSYVVNVPYWDAWHWFDVHYRSGGFAWSAYWSLFNEHRIVVPLLIERAILQVTAGDMMARGFVKLPVVFAAVALQYALLIRTTTSVNRFLLAVVFSLVTFSLAALPMWVDTRGLDKPISVLLFVAALYVATTRRPGWPVLIATASLATASSLSYFSGNLTWPVLAVVLWMRGYDRRHLAAWGVVALAVLVPYAHDFLAHESITRERPATSVLGFLQFLLVFVGAPVSYGQEGRDPLAAMIMGATGLIAGAGLIFVVARRVEDGPRKALPWVALIVWTLCGGAAAAYGRAGIGGGAYGHQGRYLLLQSQFWIGLVALAAIAHFEPRSTDVRAASIQARRATRLLWLSCGVIWLAGYVMACAEPLADGRLQQQYLQLRLGRECLRIFESADDACLAILNENPAVVRQIMRRIGAHPTFLVDRAMPLTRLLPRRLQAPAVRVEVRSGSLDLPFARARIVAARSAETRTVARAFDQTLYSPLLAQHPPSSITWSLTLPDAPVEIVTGTLVATPAKLNAQPSDGVDFRVSVTADDQRRELVSRRVQPGKPRELFTPLIVSLAEFAGKDIDLTLETSTAGTPNYDWAHWLYPRLSPRPATSR